MDQGQGNTTDKHITILGACYIALGIIGLVLGAILVVSLVGAGVLSRDAQAMSILNFIAVVVAILFVVLAIPSFITGMGLLRFRPWARVVAIILGILNLFNVPFGTILGVYTIIILMRDDVAGRFR